MSSNTVRHLIARAICYDARLHERKMHFIFLLILIISCMYFSGKKLENINKRQVNFLCQRTSCQSIATNKRAKVLGYRFDVQGSITDKVRSVAPPQPAAFINTTPCPLPREPNDPPPHPSQLTINYHLHLVQSHKTNVIYLHALNTRSL
jgi:hypothetical protein